MDTSGNLPTQEAPVVADNAIVHYDHSANHEHTIYKCYEYITYLENQLAGLEMEAQGLENAVHSLTQEKGDLKHTNDSLKQENNELRKHTMDMQKNNDRNPFTLVLIDGDGMNVSPPPHAY